MSFYLLSNVPVSNRTSKGLFKDLMNFLLSQFTKKRGAIKAGRLIPARKSGLSKIKTFLIFSLLKNPSV
jgi:hypothetical protein